MNQYEVSGILHTYAEKSSKVRNTEKLKDIIRELKSELDLRKVKVEKAVGE